MARIPQESMGGGDGGNIVLPPRTTFSDESPDPYVIEIFRIYTLRAAGHLALDLADYRYRAIPQKDTFKPLGVGFVASQLDNRRRDIGGL